MKGRRSISLVYKSLMSEEIRMLTSTINFIIYSHDVSIVRL